MLAALAVVFAIPVIAAAVAIGRPQPTAAPAAPPATGPWHGAPAIWRPPHIAIFSGRNGFLTEMRFYDVSGTTQPALVDSLNRGATDRLGWARTDLRPDPIGCYPIIDPFQRLKYSIVVQFPRWSPPADGSVRVELVERWNALQHALYAREVGYVDMYRNAIEGIMTDVSGMPNCPSVVAYLNDPYTWQQVDTARDAFEKKLLRDCRPEAGCLPPGWQGW